MEHRLEIALFMSEYENPDENPVSNFERDKEFSSIIQRLNVGRNLGPPEDKVSGIPETEQVSGNKIFSDLHRLDETKKLRYSWNRYKHPVRPTNKPLVYSTNPKDILNSKNFDDYDCDKFGEPIKIEKENKNIFEEAETFISSHTHLWKQLLYNGLEQPFVASENYDAFLESYHRLLRDIEDKNLKMILKATIFFLEDEISKGKILTSDVIQTVMCHIQKSFSNSLTDRITLRNIKKGVVTSGNSLEA